MLGITFANLRAHKGRLLLSSLAIVVATAFVAGTFVFTDAMRSALLGSFSRDLGEADVVVSAPEHADISAEALADVEGVDGVAGAERRATLNAALRSGDRFQPATIVSVTPDSGVGWPEVTRGRLPDQVGETALNRKAAQQSGLGVGDTVRVPRNWEGIDSKTNETQELRIVGLVDIGESPQYSRAPFVGVTGEQLRRLTDDYQSTMVLAVGAEGVTVAELADRIDNAVGPANEVRTAEEHAQEQLSSGGRTAGTTSALLAFAGIALFVAAIVIANTLNILLAQRTREMALLRCAGATRAQVFGSVLAESAVLGLAASAAGVVTGFGLTYAVGAVLESVSPDFPFGAVTLSATAVIVPLVVGVVVTVIAALLPARAATRIPPVAALRDQAMPAPTRRAGGIRLFVAVAAVLAGVAGMAGGILVLEGQTGFLAAFAGGALAFLGVLLAAPALIPPLVRLAGAALGRGLGAPGRLAAVNAVRNPRRATATTAALLVGVTLMTVMSVGASSVRATVNAEVDDKFPVDYMIRSSQGTIPASLADDVQDIPGISDVTEVRGTTMRLEGEEVWVSGYQPRELAAVASRMPALTALEPGEVVLTKGRAQRLGVGKGDNVRLGGETTATFTISALLPAVPGADAGAYITQRDLARILPEAPIVGVFANTSAGADLVAVGTAIDRATVGISATIAGTAQTRAVYTETLDTILLVTSALLAVAVLIAVVGIANTLALSVIERTRESAMLRALGLTRGQLRATLAVEAGLLAVVGALLGVGLGTGFGWVGLTSMLGADFEIVLDVPWAGLGGLVGGAVLAGLLASVLPGRRAARTSIVSALADE